MANPAERGPEDTLTLMIVPGQAGSIRRFHVPKLWLRRATLGGVGFAVALLALSIDYVRVRANLSELDRLRVETSEQREQIQQYAQKMEAISTKLGRIDGFERKLRIITNLDPADPLPLPGIGGTDGERTEEVLGCSGHGRTLPPRVVPPV